MVDCKYVTTPLAQHFQLSTSQSLKTKQEMAKMKNAPYDSGVGNLMYAMVCTDLIWHIMLV